MQVAPIYNRLFKPKMLNLIAVSRRSCENAEGPPVLYGVKVMFKVDAAIADHYRQAFKGRDKSCSGLLL